MPEWCRRHVPAAASESFCKRQGLHNAAPPPKPWERQGGAAAGGSAVSPLGGAASSGVSHWDQPQTQGERRTLPLQLRHCSAATVWLLHLLATLYYLQIDRCVRPADALGPRGSLHGADWFGTLCVEQVTR